MNRREFVKRAGGVGAAGWSLSPDLARAHSNGAQFLKAKTEDQMLFPGPADGASLSVTPAGLAWLPCPDSAGYRVEIHRKSGGRVYEKHVGSDPVHLPDRVLEPGSYAWDVVALDEAGNERARRGRQSFAIEKGAVELPWKNAEELLARVPREHSRLLYPKADLPAIRRTLETTRKRSWLACLTAADKALDMPAPKYPDYHLLNDPTKVRMAYGRYFGDFRRYIDSALVDLSLAFLMTEQAKYLAAAKRILLEVTSWPTNDDDVTSVSAKWGDEPGLSFSKCAHRVYDWLYQGFSPDERKRVLTMCEARAWQTHRRLVKRNYLTYPGESHNGRLIAYLADMALVMAGESEGPKTWLDYSLKAMTSFYPHWAGQDGGWAEGTPYGLWYNEFYIPAFEGLRRLAGYDLWKRPFFKNVRYFFFYCTAIRGEMRPFGDSALNGGPGVNRGSGYADLMWLHAHRFNDPNIGWWVKQIKDWEGSRGELALLFEDEPPSAVPKNLPGSRSFASVGWAGLHSDLTRPDDDTCLVFKSSPYGSVSHSHADQNSFAIMKGGKALAIPSGYYGPSYGMPHHADWTRATKANNCVLVNGEGQVIRKAEANGRIVAFKDEKGYTYVAGDATPAYMGKLRRFERHILFLRPGLFLLLDDLEAPAGSRYQWMLHALEEMKLDGTRVVSKRAGAQLDVTLRSPAGLSFHQTDQFDTPYNQGVPEEYRRDVANHWHVTAETQTAAVAARIGAVMSVSGPGEIVEVDLLEHSGWFGAKAIGAFGEASGWLQLQPGSPGPTGFGKEVEAGQAKLCGVAADGRRFSAGS
ncbi:MAG: DUF4962 domain-containing protein [Acidobacteria bacterium]|nr:MAG: DUF4962 domain-containing protein [Acidobacteriota bacterium]